MKPGERIKEFRNKKGQTQKDFSKPMQYSHSYLSDIEKGKSEPSREFLKKLTEIYGISSDYVLYGSEEEQKKYLIVKEAEARYEILPTSTKKIIDKVRKILESGNEKAIDALKANIEAFFEMACGIKNNNEDKGGY